MIHILRARLNRPGVGRMLGNRFREAGLDVQEVVCGITPNHIPKPGEFILNYGRSQLPDWYDGGAKFINTPQSVANCADKRRTFKLLDAAGVPSLDYTFSRIEAMALVEYGDKVYCRTTAKGKQGNGIVVATEPEDVVDAELYTVAFPAVLEQKVEFRVHVFRGTIIDYVQKKRMGAEKLAQWGLAKPDEEIRNHKRGWVFAHNDVVESELVRDAALQAAAAVKTDYCGVDIIGQLARGKVVEARVCEVNSAPGMSASKTKDAYVKAFLSIIG